MHHVQLIVLHRSLLALLSKFLDFDLQSIDSSHRDCAHVLRVYSLQTISCVTTQDCARRSAKKPKRVLEIQNSIVGMFSAGCARAERANINPLHFHCQFHAKHCPSNLFRHMPAPNTKVSVLLFEKKHKNERIHKNHTQRTVSPLNFTESSFETSRRTSTGYETVKGGSV